MTTDTDICNRALQMCAARQTIASLTDGSNEANNCNLLYTSLRRQVLGMAFWNFARRTKVLQLLKAAPGAPGSLVTGANNWNPCFPDPPWLFSYRYPADCIQARYVGGQDSSTLTVPIFSTQTTTYSPLLNGPAARFIVADSLVGTMNTNTDYANCDATHIVLASADQEANDFYNELAIAIDDGNGTVWVGSVTDYVNATNKVTVAPPGGGDPLPTFTFGTNPYYYNIGNLINVIQTNQQSAILVYTGNIAGLDLWSDQAQQALIAVLAGFLTIPLSGDKGLAQQLVAQANNIILQARVSDGNEGLTIQESTPDWIRVRSGYDGYGLFPDYIPQYPPLFAIS